MINTSNPPRDLRGQSQVIIVAPQEAGKTVYLAALALLPGNDPEGPVHSVEPGDEAAVKLLRLAQNVLATGGKPAGTDYVEKLGDGCTFLVEIRPSFFHFPVDKISNVNIRFSVSTLEYAGEFFDDLCTPPPASLRLAAYLTRLAECSELMIIIDSADSSREMLAKYDQSLKRLQSELSQRLQRQTRNIRIALVFSKCELPPASICRTESQQIDFVKRYFYPLKKLMDSWKKSWGCEIEYFFISAYGTVNDRANVQGRPPRTGSLRYPQSWHPQGLVAPLYWLFTGKKDTRLGMWP